MNGCFLVPANRKGGKVLLNNGFRYRRRSTTYDKYHWVCMDGTCGARLQTNKFNFDGTDNIVGMYLCYCDLLLCSATVQAVSIC